MNNYNLARSFLVVVVVAPYHIAGTLRHCRYTLSLPIFLIVIAGSRFVIARYISSLRGGTTKQSHKHSQYEIASSLRFPRKDGENNGKRRG